MDDAAPYFAKALRYLSYRPRSEKEVRDYLEGKSSRGRSAFGRNKSEPPAPEIIGAVVQKLKDMRFLDDKEFASSWVRSRTEYKLRSTSVIKMELRQKGISDEIIEEVLQSRIETKNDKMLARELLEKRKKRYEGMEKNERYQKAGGFLARKGFSFATIKAAIDSVFGKGV